MTRSRPPRTFASLSLLLVCAVALASPQRAEAQAASQPAPALLAVLELRDQLKGPHDDIDAAFFADEVREAARAAGLGLKIISRENVQVLLGAQGKSLADCEGECEVDTGRKLGADFVISGELLRIGSSLKLNLKLHDTKSATLMRGATASGKDADALDAALPAAVGQLLEPLTNAMHLRKLAQSSERESTQLAQLEETLGQLRGELARREAGLGPEATRRFAGELEANMQQLMSCYGQLTHLNGELAGFQSAIESGEGTAATVRTNALETRLAELDDQTRRLHTRIALFSDNLLSGGAPVAPAQPAAAQPVRR